MQVDVHIVVKAGMVQGLRHRKISVVQTDIFPDQTDLHTVFSGIVDALHHLCPFTKVRFRHLQAKFSADHIGKMRLLQHQRRLIQIG